MAETSVENRICSKCGAEVRKGALFCYHCGGTVAPELPAPELPVPENHRPDGDKLPAEVLVKEVVVVENIKPVEEAAENQPEVLEAADIPVKKPDIIEESKLKSAASLRRKPKTLPQRKVEQIVWTGHENAPNAWFIVVALILTLLAVGIFWLAMNLR